MFECLVDWFKGLFAPKKNIPTYPPRPRPKPGPLPEPKPLPEQPPAPVPEPVPVPPIVEPPPPAPVPDPAPSPPVPPSPVPPAPTPFADPIIKQTATGFTVEAKDLKVGWFYQLEAGGNITTKPVTSAIGLGLPVAWGFALSGRLRYGPTALGPWSNWADV